MFAAPACLELRRFRNADGRGCVLDEIPRIAYHDPFTGVVASPGDSVLTPRRPSIARTLVLLAGIRTRSCSGRPQVSVKKLVDAMPRIAQHVLAAEVMKFARVHHERNQIALVFLESLIHEPDRLEERHVDVRGAM